MLRHILRSRWAASAAFAALASFTSGASAQQQLPAWCLAFLQQAATAPAGLGKKPKPFGAAFYFAEQFGPPTAADQMNCPAGAASALASNLSGRGSSSLFDDQPAALAARNCAFDSGGGTLAFSGRNVELIAQNGQKVRADYCGVATTVGLVPPNSLQNVMSGGFVVTGVKDRESNSYRPASGHGSLSGLEVLSVQAINGVSIPVSAVGSLRMDGSISR